MTPRDPYRKLEDVLDDLSHGRTVEFANFARAVVVMDRAHGLGYHVRLVPAYRLIPEGGVEDQVREDEWDDLAEAEGWPVPLREG